MCGESTMLWKSLDYQVHILKTNALSHRKIRIGCSSSRILMICAENVKNKKTTGVVE
jgi:hypothetical protein